jgi:hypothetical protein
MFEEDGPAQLLLLPAEVRSDDDDEVEFDAQVAVSEPVVVVGGNARAEIMVEDVVVEDVKVKTLRELLYEQEPWINQPETATPGLRRLMEKRVNRVLDVVANWMLGLVENHVGDVEALVILLEQAESVRKQIEWPELEAAGVATGMTQGQLESER